MSISDTNVFQGALKRTISPKGLRKQIHPSLTNAALESILPLAYTTVNQNSCTKVNGVTGVNHILVSKGVSFPPQAHTTPSPINISGRTDL